MTTSAFTFHDEYDRQFRATTVGFAHNEIPLFQAMRSTLLSLSGKFEIEEYHGWGHQVTFLGDGTYARTGARCELSDLAIITFSPIRKQARLTYIQAKSERATLTHGAVRFRKFGANLEQWYLLSARPDIAGVNLFAPPQALLRSALLPSVGTFAFFYKDSAGAFQTLYASADYLEPVIKGKKISRRLKLVGPCISMNVCGHMECKAAIGNISFARSLFDMEIGTPVNAESGAPRDVRNWLSANLKSQIKSAASAPEQSNLAQELIDILRPDDRQTSSGSFGAKSLIIIKSNAEPKNKKDQNLN